MKFRGRALTDLVSTVGSALITLLLAYRGYGVFSLAWGAVSGASIRAIGLNIVGQFPGLPIFSFAGCGSMFNFGRNVAAAQLVWFFYSQADSFIVGKLLGKHDLGIYSVSMDLASLPASRVSAILNQIVFPSLSKVKREGGSVGPYLLKGMSGVSLLSFPVMWGLSCIAPELVQVLLGQKWTEAVLPLALLCLIIPLRVLSPILHSGLHAVGRADVSFRVTYITATTMCSAFLVGAQFGLLGLSLSWVLIFPIVFMFNMSRSVKLLQLTNRQIASVLFKPALGCGLMYGIVAIARGILPWAPIVNLILLVIIGAISYVVFTLLLNRKSLSEVTNLIRRPPSTEIS